MFHDLGSGQDRPGTFPKNRPRPLQVAPMHPCEVKAISFWLQRQEPSWLLLSLCSLQACNNLVPIAATETKSTVVWV